MNSLARLTFSTKAIHMAPKALTAVSVGSSRMFSLKSDLTKKEKVEEDRYIRQKEHEAYLVRKAQEEATKAARELTEAEIAAKEQHDAVISEIFGIMSQTRDKVSDECIEKLANWKIGK